MVRVIFGSASRNCIYIFESIPELKIQQMSGTLCICLNKKLENNNEFVFQYYYQFKIKAFPNMEFYEIFPQANIEPLLCKCS